MPTIHRIYLRHRVHGRAHLVHHPSNKLGHIRIRMPHSDWSARLNPHHVHHLHTSSRVPRVHRLVYLYHARSLHTTAGANNAHTHGRQYHIHIVVPRHPSRLPQWSCMFTRYLFNLSQLCVHRPLLARCTREHRPQSLHHPTMCTQRIQNHHRHLKGVHLTSRIQHHVDIPSRRWHSPSTAYRGSMYRRIYCKHHHTSCRHHHNIHVTLPTDPSHRHITLRGRVHLIRRHCRKYWHGHTTRSQHRIY